MYRFCDKLRELRNTVGSQRDMANKCGVSRETIRLVEAGKLIPSNEILAAWLDTAGLQLTERKDIVSEVLQAKRESTAVGRDISALEAIVSGEVTFSSTDAIVHELTSILMESGGMTEGMREGQRKRLERVFEKHGFVK